MELHPKGKPQPGMVAHTCNSSIRRWRQEKQEFRSARAKRRKKYIAKRQNVDTALLSRVTEQHCGKNVAVDRQHVQKQVAE